MFYLHVTTHGKKWILASHYGLHCCILLRVANVKCTEYPGGRKIPRSCLQPTRVRVPQYSFHPYFRDVTNLFHSPNHRDKLQLLRLSSRCKSCRAAFPWLWQRFPGELGFGQSWDLMPAAWNSSTTVTEEIYNNVLMFLSWRIINENYFTDVSMLQSLYTTIVTYMPVRFIFLNMTTPPTWLY